MTDGNDRRTLMTLLDSYYNDECAAGGCGLTPSGTYVVPPPKSRADVSPGVEYSCCVGSGHAICMHVSNIVQGVHTSNTHGRRPCRFL